MLLRDQLSRSMVFMFRTTLHLLLIAALLACPVRCFAHSVASLADGNVQTKGCSCCDACDTGSDASEESGDFPDDGCNCQDCICKGAITQNDGEAFATADVEFSVFLASIEFPLSRISTQSAGSNFDHLNTSGYLSGRDARIAHQSLLI
ncbi:hypothetical protein [Rubripirellula reticaptiva]|uniref:Uncharacterized protein n=1 Tax=Rubripirellula reticaptiva TaxID=2528013 RepID=A0A5C6F401_9BACT|nr:hypothetical protein [Rubripirellula reticaptiva]TWU55832.1 hypothetical protein Poly59_21350 [Rubripirellula reticaptiva]